MSMKLNDQFFGLNSKSKKSLVKIVGVKCTLNCEGKGGYFVQLELFLFVSVQRVKIIDFRRGELKLKNANLSLFY